MNVDTEEILLLFQIVSDRVAKTQTAIDAITEPKQRFRPVKHKTQSQVEDQLRFNKIYQALLAISDDLANSYMQAKTDLDNDSRFSWAGSAHEIRQVLASMLWLLAPDSEVCSQSWYKKTPDTSGPTQKQRVRYILQMRNGGSKEREVLDHVTSLEKMIEDLVRSTYARASDAAHRFKAKDEVSRIMRYFEAFAFDLLNLN
ncbi:MAG: hypothetical protein H6658_17315 [Ardenticatenaceae bacterium]|nr:hypothetical protein [Ardenticatenaceae bacterium]